MARQVSYILYYEGRFNSTTECLNGPSCCNRMFKWGREGRCFLRGLHFEGWPWSDEKCLRTLSWPYKNIFSWFLKWSTSGHEMKFWMMKASENILSTTYFMSDGYLKFFIKFQRGARTGRFKFLWMARKWFENFWKQNGFSLDPTKEKLLSEGRFLQKFLVWHNNNLLPITKSKNKENIIRLWSTSKSSWWKCSLRLKCIKNTLSISFKFTEN